jgi:23S rRNA (cytidine1920-2'-O)/16S rRNA (cytidine1409-2'-O)-methyltransferase
MTRTTRLDLELVERGAARSRTHARQLIVEGLVQVNGTVVRRPAERVGTADVLMSHHDRYVSRAAHKLNTALDELDLEVGGRALDAGSSTGGFTQVLLERGCEPVYAVDVGTGQLNATLRRDPRVVVWEQTNLRDLELRHVGGEPVDLVVADVSFISLVLLVERLSAVTKRSGQLLLMVKPQFEVGRELLGKGGVVRSAGQHGQAIAAVVAAAERWHWFAHQVVPSRVRGPAGNIEYFVHFRSVPPGAQPDLDGVAGNAVK